MFPHQNHHQTTFVYGPDVYKKLIPENHILCRINKQVDFSFVNEACKDLYSQNQGRPVKNLPEIMFRSAIVQFLMNYSDRWKVSIHREQKKLKKAQYIVNTHLSF